MFHVPEQYRITTATFAYRHSMASDASYGQNGAFFLPPKIPGRELWVIASDGTKEPDIPPWEHVSVHAANSRNKLFMPCWEEMCYVKNCFWDAEDTVMQLHPPESTWINCHPTTLHLWRPVTERIPLPPGILVGIRQQSGVKHG